MNYNTNIGNVYRRVLVFCGA